MSETITDTTARLKQFMAESFPDADIAPGAVLSELVVKPQATAQNPLRNSILEVGQANSIQKALESPVDTYETIIDYIGSNYNAVRSQGRKSVGKIKVSVTSRGTFPIRKGTKFLQPVLNLNYVTTSDIVAVEKPTGANEIPLIKSGGSYYFIVPVEAEFAGVNYQVSDQTAFNILAPARITGFIEGKAYGSFTSGADIETDKEFIRRFQNTLSNRTLLTKASISARLHDLYPSFADVSLVGANDPEMTRSKHNLMGISSLGVVDVYVRTSLGAETKTVLKQAQKLTNDTWSFSLTHEDACGFYRVIAVSPQNEALLGSLSFTSTFDFSTANLDTINSVTTLPEARFTKYQTCDIVVDYTPASPDFSGYFDVLVSYQPFLGEIQELFLTSNERIACADYLVKAVHPCFVSIGLKVHKNNSASVIPVESLKQDIYSYVNRLPIGERLQASNIIDICHNYDIKYVEMPIILQGEIYSNTSSTVSISGVESLSIPSRPEIGISPKTTAFVIDYFRADGDNRMVDGISIDVL